MFCVRTSPQADLPHFNHLSVNSVWPRSLQDQCRGVLLYALHISDPRWLHNTSILTLHVGPASAESQSHCGTIDCKHIKPGVAGCLSRRGDRLLTRKMDVKCTAKPQHLSREFHCCQNRELDSYRITPKTAVLPVHPCSVHIHLSQLCLDGELKN